LSFDLLTSSEHVDCQINRDIVPLTRDSYAQYFSKKHRGKDASLPCFLIDKLKNEDNKYHLKTSYFIGLGWIEPEKIALFIEPKLNSTEKKIDFIKMLFGAMRHPDVATEINELFEVKWEQPTIEIEQKQDLLTPLLVVEFLSLLKIIVRKGLKKSYYKVERNLNGRVKGKVLTGKSIKHNLLQNKNLMTYCSYDVFGLNNKENRILKKALSFIKRYLPSFPQLTIHRELQDIFNYINPAFHGVSDKIELNEIKDSKTNAFYKEYEPAIRLAKLILKRFGYNISNTAKDTIQTPPFWIDMSKLFELYVLGLLKDRFQKQVKFQFKHYGNELDYLLKSDEYKMVIDAKYKLKYLDGKYNEDIRQVSGYARLKKVYEELGVESGNLIDCLIIYPDQKSGFEDLEDTDLKSKRIEHYVDIYKLGVKLPFIK
jgi:5-methylcytosine-specific restriction enzyme subunit McrC